MSSFHDRAKSSCVFKDASGERDDFLQNLPFLPILAVAAVGIAYACGILPKLARKLLSKPSFSTFPWFSAWLDLNNGELLAVLAYIAACSAPIVIQGLDVGAFSAAYVSGFISEISLALLIIPATRTSLLVRVFSMSYDRAIRFHRWLAFWAIAGAWVHAGVYLIKSPCVLSKDEKHAKIALAGIAMFSFLMAMSLDIVRRRCFEVFRAFHWLFVVAYILLIIHVSSIALFLIAPVSIYVYDRARRFLRSRHVWSVSQLTCHGQVTMIQLKAPAGLHFEHTAGQFCFIRIPMLSAFEWHPISITSGGLGNSTATAAVVTTEPGSPAAPNPGFTQPPYSTSDTYITFCVKAMEPGSWSDRLRDLAVEPNRTAELVAHVDGPFGTLSTPIASAKHVVLIGGGIGAAPLVSVLQSFSSNAAPTYERVTFIMIVRTAAELSWCATALTAACQLPKVTVHVFITRGEEGNAVNLPGAIVRTGRPDFTSLLVQADDQLVPVGAVAPLPSSTGSVMHADDVTVLASGPVSMLNDVRAVCVSRGFNFHNETFLF